MNSSGSFLLSRKSLLSVPLSKWAASAYRNHKDEHACGRVVWRAAGVETSPNPVGEGLAPPAEVAITSAADYVRQRLNRKYLRFNSTKWNNLRCEYSRRSIDLRPTPRLHLPRGSKGILSPWRGLGRRPNVPLTLPPQWPARLCRRWIRPAGRGRLRGSGALLRPEPAPWRGGADARSGRRRFR